MKALCGFRDAVLQDEVSTFHAKCLAAEAGTSDVVFHAADPSQQAGGELKRTAQQDSTDTPRAEPSVKRFVPFHNAQLDRKAADRFRIFVCEGQPKNHTAWRGRIVFHDGIMYTQKLAEHGFRHIYIVPDAIAATLLDPFGELDKGVPRIDFVIVGANGFDAKCFFHSAGHAMVISAARFAVSQRAVRPGSAAADDNAEALARPLVVLALTTDKFSERQDGKAPDSGEPRACATPTVARDEPHMADGWPFQVGFAKERTRRNVFVSQDLRSRRILNEEAPDARFYNPREDRIPIEHVDVVLTERVWLARGAGPPLSGGQIRSQPRDSGFSPTPPAPTEKPPAAAPPPGRARRSPRPAGDT